jgi:flagellar hook-basal body complex protein FliE
MIVVEETEAAFQLMTEIRQKILGAYQEVTRMQI